MIGDWKLPEDFEAAVSEHHAGLGGGAWGMSELVKVSCRMADVLGFPASPNCDKAEFEVLIEDLPERERRSLGMDRVTLAAEIADGIHAIEAV